jgi:hypothetical protein
VEYYSGNNLGRQEEYNERMKLFVSSKAVMKLIKNNKESLPQRKPNSKNFKQRHSSVFKMEIIRMNFKKNKKTCSIKEMIKKFEQNVNKAMSNITKQLNLQRENFIEKIKLKNLRNVLKSDTIVRKDSYIKRKVVYDVDFSGRKNDIKHPTSVNLYSEKLSFESLEEEYENLGVKNESNLFKKLFDQDDSTDTIKNPNKKTKKKAHIGKQIDSFIQDWHEIYMNKFCLENVQKSIDIFNTKFTTRKENFNEYNFSVCEVESSLRDNLSKINFILLDGTAIKLYRRILDSLRIDYEKNIIDIDCLENRKIQNLTIDAKEANLTEIEEINKLSDHFISTLIKVFK